MLYINNLQTIFENCENEFLFFDAFFRKNSAENQRVTKNQHEFLILYQKAKFAYQKT